MEIKKETTKNASTKKYLLGGGLAALVIVAALTYTSTQGNLFKGDLSQIKTQALGSMNSENLQMSGAGLSKVSQDKYSYDLRGGSHSHFAAKIADSNVRETDVFTAKLQSATQNMNCKVVAAEGTAKVTCPEHMVKDTEYTLSIEKNNVSYATASVNTVSKLLNVDTLVTSLVAELKVTADSSKLTNGEKYEAYCSDRSGGPDKSFETSTSNTIRLPNLVPNKYYGCYVQISNESGKALLTSKPVLIVVSK